MDRSKCIGIDVGYGYTKVVSDTVEGLGKTQLPSVVGNFEDRIATIEGLKPSSLDLVEIDGQKLLVGNSALKHSARIFNAREKDWIGSMAYRALMKNGIHQTNLSSISIVITSGLPVSYYKADRAKLTNLIREVAKGDAITTKIKVIPQPLGSFFKLLFDNNGEVQNEGLVTARIGVLDIGFYTSDILTIDNLEPVEKQIASFENGVAGTLEAISKDIEDRYDLRQDIHKTEETLRKGSLRAYGVDHDIAGMAKQRLTELATEIEAHVKTVWKSAADIDQVLLTGGGAALLKDYLNFYRHATVIEDAQFANAEGYYKYSRRIAHGE
jgi:PRTRC genetic system protein D